MAFHSDNKCAQPIDGMKSVIAEDKCIKTENEVFRVKESKNGFSFTLYKDDKCKTKDVEYTESCFEYKNYWRSLSRGRSAASAVSLNYLSIFFMALFIYFLF